jgi:hypothetical protein
MSVSNDIRLGQAAVADDEIGRLARKINRDWTRPASSRPRSGGSVLQRMPHGGSHSVKVEIRRPRRPRNHD